MRFVKVFHVLVVLIILSILTGCDSMKKTFVKEIK
jgi:predicted small lipoprotein YifL